MRWVVLLLCLAGAAGVWGWALLAPKEAKIAPLPARFAGTFRFIGYDAPQGRAFDNPLPPGLSHLWTFRPDGTYVFSVLVSGGYEVVREEGVVAVGSDGVLTMTRISRNRVEDRGPGDDKTPAEQQPVRSYHAEWGEDQGGPFLALRHATVGYVLRIRPEKAE